MRPTSRSTTSSPGTPWLYELASERGTGCPAAPVGAILPIGGHYTMDPKEAALALEFLGTKRCIPCHYGTFPPLVGTPAQLRELAPDVQIEDLEPGGSVTL